jgi:hypothetical protein
MILNANLFSIESLVTGGSTADIVSPLVNQIQQPFKSATTSLKTLVGQDPATIFVGDSGEPFNLSDLSNFISAPINVCAMFHHIIIYWH